MAVIDKRNTLSACVLLFLIAVAAGYWAMTRGYGEVSPTTYQLSKALYAACLNRNADHLARVEAMLNDPASQNVPPNERAWLAQIIQRARSGQWESAAKNARRIMEDQVQH